MEQKPWSEIWIPFSRCGAFYPQSGIHNKLLNPHGLANLYALGLQGAGVVQAEHWGIISRNIFHRYVCMYSTEYHLRLTNFIVPLSHVESHDQAVILR